MKKVFIVSKTHLDLGFTDYAENVLNKYLTDYIPNAIKTANEVNTIDKKRFVWTTGSWLLKKALEVDENDFVKNALKNGNIAPHGLPFTMHTELLDGDSLDYALSLVDELDEIIGTKTTAAKMTDVPGHTISLVPILAKHGIKLLHIGVNGASAMPNVPECFLWRHRDGSEVVVIYSGSYGGEFKCDLVDEILYFDHTVDNRGARNKADTIKAFERVEALYPDYEVEASRMDDYANAIWEVRDKLPVVTSEIGDTWIHGLATDPYKTASVKELIKLKNDAVKNGKIDVNSNEYKALMENILCVAEHTWGGDSKVFLSDYSHYDKEGFTIARQNDDVTQSEDIANTEYGLDVIEKRKTGEYNEGSYRAIEKAWQEQRNYIKKGINALDDELKAKAEEVTKSLIPTEPKAIISNDNRTLENGKIKLVAGDNGAVDIYYNNALAFDSKGRTPISYMAFSADDYDVWLSSYTRDFDDNHIWSLPDFCRPYLHNVDGKYAFGDYAPGVSKISCDDDKMHIEYCSDSVHSDGLGCPRIFQLCYQIKDDSVLVNVSWFNKDASRIPEATMIRFYPSKVSGALAKKCGDLVDISDIVENGNRRLFGTEAMHLKSDKDITIINHHSPLCIPGYCNLVRFSNNYPSINDDGIAFVLHDSIWGTNFPLWYDDNASFDFTIEFK